MDLKGCLLVACFLGCFGLSDGNRVIYVKAIKLKKKKSKSINLKRKIDNSPADELVKISVGLLGLSSDAFLFCIKE